MRRENAGAWTNQWKIAGYCTREEKEWHLNTKELKAATLAVKAFAKRMTDAHLILHMDNITSVAQVNKKKGQRQSAY